MSFTYLLFPVFFLLVFFFYNLFPLKQRYLVLLASSLIFYGLNGWEYLVAILSLSLLTYLFSFGSKIKTKKKWLLVYLDAAIVVGSLVLLKYYNSTLRLFSLSNDYFLNIIFPLGYSFYALSSISYIVSIYEEKTEIEKNPLKLLLFLSFFLTVLQGPLTRYSSLRESFSSPKPFDEHKALRGLSRAAIGYFKKLVIADSLALYVSSVYGSLTSLTGFPLFLAMILYSVVIYMDFSGYSDIAIGLAAVLGIDLPENFNLPYLSHNLQEFWRKWHMSLSFWYRDYIYIPLGGSRVNKFRWVLNILTVWLLTGLWHDFTIPYLLWGVTNGAILILLALFKPIIDKHLRNKPFFNTKWFGAIRISFTFLLVTVLWVLFRSPDLTSISLMLGKAWRIFDFSSFLDGSFAAMKIAYLPLTIGLIGTALLILCHYLSPRLKTINPTSSLKTVLAISIFAILIAGSFTNSLYLSSLGGGSNGFIYFNF